MTLDENLTTQQRAWGSTMKGHRTGGVETAHADSSAVVGAGPGLSRERREELDAEMLRPGATLSSGAGDRAIEEAPDNTRTSFERDRDRILHATAFRRLAGKTQVFVFPDDHQRTRLTHALEVAQVARSISRALGLNVPLTEAIALGHDCGHGPGGHSSEDALTPFLDEGFDHAVWGADITLVPLNLCVETLDGIRNHSWSRPAPSTPEGEVVSWADRIAYVCHDFEDAVNAGVVRTDELPESVRDSCGSSRRTQLAAFIGSMIDATDETGMVGMNADTAEALAAFRGFNYERIYLRPESQQQARLVVEVLRGLVDYLTEHPERLPVRLFDQQIDREQAVARAAVAWVAGMTDRYAFTFAKEWLGMDQSVLPRGVDI